MENTVNQPLSFLVADSAEELRSMMLLNNRRHARKFHYMNPVPFDGKWYVWFEISVEDKEKRDMVDGSEE